MELNYLGVDFGVDLFERGVLFESVQDIFRGQKLGGGYRIWELGGFYHQYRNANDGQLLAFEWQIGSVDIKGEMKPAWNDVAGVYRKRDMAMTQYSWYHIAPYLMCFVDERGI